MVLRTGHPLSLTGGKSHLPRVVQRLVPYHPTRPTMGGGANEAWMVTLFTFMNSQEKGYVTILHRPFLGQ